VNTFISFRNKSPLIALTPVKYSMGLDSILLDAEIIPIFAKIFKEKKYF
jgi:hypothetical protein